MTKQKINKEIVITGLLCLTVLEIVALCNGIDGTLFSFVLVIIAGAIGITIPTPKIK